MEHLANWVAHYGYAAIFSLLVFGIVGLPVPDEWMLTFAGYLVFTGHLRPIPALGSAMLGSMCGITVSYILGRSLGLYLIHRYGWFFHISSKDMDRVHAWFARFGTWTLVFGYFVPGVRHFTAIVAGTSELPPRTFALYAYSGALIWSSTFIAIGYFFGEQWDKALQQIQRHSAMAAWIVLAVVAVYLLVSLRKGFKAKKGKPNATDSAARPPAPTKLT
jgi:membrane protein DedA with SNARE-associated domain